MTLDNLQTARSSFNQFFCFQQSKVRLFMGRLHELFMTMWLSEESIITNHRTVIRGVKYCEGTFGDIHSESKVWSLR